MAKFLIEVNEDGITHEEIVDLLTGETDDEEFVFIDADALTVTRLRDETEIPEDALYQEEPEKTEDPQFPSNVEEVDSDTDK